MSKNRILDWAACYLRPANQKHDRKKSDTALFGQDSIALVLLLEEAGVHHD
jgi:hypothetical protein